MKHFLFSLALLSSTTLFAQTPDTAQLSRYLETLAQNNKVMGSVALLKDGKVIYQKAVGQADVAKNFPNTTDTRFRIGSISKSFTAAMILKAVEEKKLRLEQPIGSFFPAYPTFKNITVEQLLRHRSGIHNFTADDGFLSWNTRPHSEAEMLQIIAKGGMDFPADSTFEYSNSGYVLLSYILEKTYKKQFARVLEEKITKPLGLKSTGIWANTKEPFLNTSYTWNGKWEAEKFTDVSVPLGAGAIASTPADLTRFYEALLEGKFLSAASVTKMKEMQEGYGMGLIMFPFNKQKGYGHTGGIDGFHSMAGYFPDSKTAFAIVENGLNFKTNDVAIALLQTANGEKISIPEFKAKSTSASSAGYPGTYENAAIGMKITITQEGEIVTAQATGQSAFPLEMVSKDNYQFTAAGIKIKFLPAENAFMLQQGGAEMRFEKE